MEQAIIHQENQARGLQIIQYGDIRPSFFNNGIKGMGMGICQDAAPAVLLVREGGGKRPENK